MDMVKQNGKDILPSFNVKDGALDSWLCLHAAYNVDGKYWLLPQTAMLGCSFNPYPANVENMVSS